MKTAHKLVVFALISMTSVLGMAQGKEAADFSNKVRVNFKAKDITSPNISLVYKNGGIPNAEGKVEVVIRILDEGGIGGFTINDTQLNGDKADSVVNTFYFMPGQEVNVSARDLANNVKDRTFVIKETVLAPVVVAAAINSAPQHKFYALIMGVQEYDDPAITPLEHPVEDATRLKKILTEKYTFDETNVTFLKNPTNDEMQLAFEDLSNKVTAQDFLLIFYAGHGYFDKDKKIGYWLPKDAKKANTLRWFRNSALVEDIGGIPSLHTLLIADACFSGGIFKTRSAFNNATPDVSYMLKTPSRKAITSGSLTTVPDESVFLKYLTKVLAENDKLYLSSEDLFYEVKRAVVNNSDQQPLYGEIAKVGDEGGTFVFIQRNK